MDSDPPQIESQAAPIREIMRRLYLPRLVSNGTDFVP